MILHNPEQLKLSTLRGVMRNIFPLSQDNLAAPYADKIIAEIPRINDEADLGYITAYANIMVPESCNNEGIVRLKTAVEKFKAMKPQIVKAYKGALQDQQRCVAIVSKAFTQ